MALDLLNLQPSVISRDLKGKFVCIYSIPKAGKTSLACQFPKNLLLGFEHGWNAISGAMAVDITKWADFKLYLRQLEKPELKEKFNTITIDTVGLAWEMCEQYICSQNSVQKISDIPWGGGYTACKKEFEACLRKITQLGYGLVIIAHSEKRIEKRSDDSEVEILGPAIPKRAYDIVNQLVDIIGYIDVTWDEDGGSERWLYTRKTPTIMAGSRFKYLPPKIKFGYEELVNAISKAIEDSERLDGAMVVEHAIETPEDKTLTYEEVRDKAKSLWETLVAKDPEENPKRIMKKVEMIFGRPLKLSEINEDQVDLYNLVVLEMEEMLRSA
jgi:hypothetical protein